MRLIEIRKAQIIELCQYIQEYYKEYLTIDELEKVNQINQKVNLNSLNVNEINAITAFFLPIVNRIWDIELKSGDYIIISWNKYYEENQDKPLTFATISKRNNIVSFCELGEGTEYEISYSSIIGCLYKDGATLIEDLDKKNEYTIGMMNGKVINSYNGATKLMTPEQLVAKRENNYYTNYNELILDTRLIKKIGKYEMNSITKRM